MHTDLLHLQRYHDSGDAVEFHALVQHHARMVFATACRVTRDPSLAEDVAQETFLELARKGRSITESVGAWLHRVAWRRACDAVRAEKTRQRYESAAFALNEGRECTWEELEPMFDEAISELAAEERTAIVEHYLEGRTQTEIAARTGLSQSSVSRLLEQSITHLRSTLKKKGLLCGAALGGMMAASSAQAAAPATLMAALHKIGLSSIGSGAAAANGGSLFAAIAGLNFKLVVSYAVPLVACAAGFDLASKDSHLARWFSREQTLTTTKSGAQSSKTSQAAAQKDSGASASKARLLAEAKAIWAKKSKLSKAELERHFGELIFERDPEKRFAKMHTGGISLSRAQYDRILARHPDIHLFDQRQAAHALSDLFCELSAAWIIESPRQAIVWSSSRGPAGHWFYPTITPWVRSHPDEWAAFVEAGPDPHLGDYAKLWVDHWDDPGSIWAKAKDAGLDHKVIEESIFLFISTGAPTDFVLPLIMRAPDAQVRSKYILGIAMKVSSEQLLQAANSGSFQDAGLVNTLRAIGGDPKAAFGPASAWVTQAANGGGLEAAWRRPGGAGGPMDGRIRRPSV